MRLIDADALREIVEDGLRNNPHTDGYARSCHRVEYTHFLDVICRMPTIAPPPNDPLTLDELREMDREPVWIQHLGENKDSRWRIIKYSTDAGLHVEDSYPALYYGWDTYGWLWNAYRRKPEEGTA